MQVINEFLHADALDAERVVKEYYGTFTHLLQSPIAPLRSWVYALLIDMFKPKAYFLQLLSQGYVECLFLGLTKFRIHMTILDSYSQVFEIESTYNTSLILSIVRTLNSILLLCYEDVKFPCVTEAEFRILMISVFTMEHIDVVRMLHYLICEEIESSRLTDAQEPDLIPLINELPKLLANIKALHVRCESSIAHSVATEVDHLLSMWQDKLNQAVKNSETLKRIRADNHGTSDMECEQGSLVIPKKLPYIKHIVGSHEYELLVQPLWRTVDMNGQALDEPDRLFLIPVTVSVESLVKSLSNFFSRLIHLVWASSDPGSFVEIVREDQLQQLLAEAEKDSRVTVENKVARVVLQAKLALPGEITFQNATAVLQPRETALRQVQQVAHSHGIKINPTVMGEVYTFFQAQNKSEIDVEQFVLFMREKLGIPDMAARPLFRSFDTDSSGTLSLTEIALGLALLVEGSADDRVIAAFNAYDADRSGSLDYEEILNMVRVVKGVTKEVAQFYSQGTHHSIKAYMSLSTLYTQCSQCSHSLTHSLTHSLYHHQGRSTTSVCRWTPI